MNSHGRFFRFRQAHNIATASSNVPGVHVLMTVEPPQLLALCRFIKISKFIPKTLSKCKPSSSLQYFLIRRVIYSLALRQSTRKSRPCLLLASINKCSFRLRKPTAGKSMDQPRSGNCMAFDKHQYARTHLYLHAARKNSWLCAIRLQRQKCERLMTYELSSPASFCVVRRPWIQPLTRRLIIANARSINQDERASATTRYPPAGGGIRMSRPTDARMAADLRDVRRRDASPCRHVTLPWTC
jgi:hypothetical protein